MFHLPKLGKLVKLVDHRTLKLANYGLASLAAPPATCNLTGKISRLGMMLNDTLGDCTCAAAGHMVQAWTAEAGNQVIVANSAVLKAYEAAGGYRPNNPSTDNGAECLTVLKYWRAAGVGGHKIGAFAEIDPTKADEIRKAVFYFGGVYTGFQLPISAQGQNSWQVATGPDAEPGSWGGHCVPIVAYDAEGVWVITWGMLLKASWAFIEKYCDEAYAVLSQDILLKTGASPEGLKIAQLQTDLNRIA